MRNFPSQTIALAAIAAATLGTSAAADVSYNNDIRPILSDKCFACHGSDEKQRKAKLRLDGAEGAYRPDEDGVAAIKPGDPAKSELWARVTSDDPDEVMPPPKSHKPPLKPEQRALLRRWIEQGAVYQRHWAFEPIRRPAVPAAGDAAANPVDRFIVAKLAARGLGLAPQASRESALPAGHARPHGPAADPGRNDGLSRRHRTRTPTNARSIACSPRRTTAKTSRAAGSMPCAMPTRTACISTTNARSGRTSRLGGARTSIAQPAVRSIHH